MHIDKTSVRYENDYFSMVRKPQGLASTFGTEESFLDILILEQSLPIQHLQEQRKGIDRELGLINRLDNATGGLLFFAKNIDIYKEYKLKQEHGEVDKIYYADLYGCFDITKLQSSNAENRRSAVALKHCSIETAIFHHYSDPSRMTTDPKLGRGRTHAVKTFIEPLEYNTENNYTTCRIIIHKGIRHQIRVHCASIGHHIIGDSLYCPKQFRSNYKSNTIHLRSMGISIQ